MDGDARPVAGLHEVERRALGKVGVGDDHLVDVLVAEHRLKVGELAE